MSNNEHVRHIYYDITAIVAFSVLALIVVLLMIGNTPNVPDRYSWGDALPAAAVFGLYIVFALDIWYHARQIVSADEEEDRRV